MALKELALNPLIGVGFRGFSDATGELSKFGELAGLSPHNQYLTAIWKMGVVASIPYFLMIMAMLGRAFYCLEKYRRHWFVALTIGVILVFCNLWDVLIVPNVGALFFYILGVFAASGRSGDAFSSVNDRISR